MNKRAVEQTGLIPRSIIRTFERFLKQLLPGAEKLVIQEFRISRYQVIVSVRCFLTLLIVPVLVNILSKTFLITPFVEFLWNKDSTEIFLNSYQQKRALHELHCFEDKIYFESLLNFQMKDEKFKIEETVFDPSYSQTKQESYAFIKNNIDSLTNNSKVIVTNPTIQNEIKFIDNSTQSNLENINQKSILLAKVSYQEKLLEIANTFNKESIEAISNLFADFFSVFSFSLVFIFMKPQIIILKSFLAESLYSLSDTTKSFLLILGTDLLVGFHSPHGWEVFLESFLRHLGLPENLEFMSLFVATFPVFLDTVFKYWIFRSLNKISPSTVATYHNMIE